jgi:UDP-N-acetylmuramate--alanine ligase
MLLNDLRTIYFIGIGGIGMSALARYFHKQGIEIHGYDRTETDLTRALVAEGMRVHYDDDICYIPKAVDLVVWTPAVPHDHAELTWFRTHNVPLKKRAEVLGIISRSKRCVAIGGTHGKTTTSTLTAHLMRSCGIDATAFVGGISGNLGSNFIEGDSDWVVVEADEYDRSFLHLHPDVAVLNAVDADHLDIYGSADEVRKTYEQFANQVKNGGHLLLQSPDVCPPGTHWTTAGSHHTFGIEVGDFRAERVRVEEGYTVFDLHTPMFGVFTNLRMAYPGLHNVRNACAAIAATLLAGGKADQVATALADFKGVKRRFEYIVRQLDRVYIDDYAHHPAELEATIQAARSLYPSQRLTGVFQPHLFSRTRDFLAGFAAALDRLDECILLPIYPARELPIPGVTSELILSKMNLDKKMVVQKENLIEKIKEIEPTVLLTMGAGDIDNFVQPIKKLYDAT